MLTQLNKKKIREIVKKGKCDARVICRANALHMRISLRLTAIEVADCLQITSRTVFNIEKNYEEGGLEKALYDDPRPGPPAKFDDCIKSQIVALVCSDPPDGFDRWTLDLIVEKSVEVGIVDGIHRDTVRVILREHDFKPWQQKMWCIPNLDQNYIDKMEDVLRIYESNFSSKNPLVCLDEKLVQLSKNTRPPCGGFPSDVKKVDYEYNRKGTANVFCAVLPKEGVYINRVTERRTKTDFAKFLASIERNLSDAKKITLVMDNLNTHNERSLIEFYGEEEGRRIWNRFDVHYTPTHGSWLNQAEIAINIYARQCLGKSRIPTIEELRKKTKFWNRSINCKGITINWKFTRKKAREKFKIE